MTGIVLLIVISATAILTAMFPMSGFFIDDELMEEHRLKKEEESRW